MAFGAEHRSAPPAPTRSSAVWAIAWFTPVLAALSFVTAALVYAYPHFVGSAALIALATLPFTARAVLRPLLRRPAAPARLRLAAALPSLAAAVELALLAAFASLVLAAFSTRRCGPGPCGPIPNAALTLAEVALFAAAAYLFAREGLDDMRGRLRPRRELALSAAYLAFLALLLAFVLGATHSFPF